MGALPHPTIQKFAVITVAIVGASRRFLAQITRHQNEVKFMSASLQYSNYTGPVSYTHLVRSGSHCGPGDNTRSSPGLPYSEDRAFPGLHFPACRKTAKASGKDGHSRE